MYENAVDYIVCNSLVFLGICGLISGYVYGQKGRSPLAGFLGGLFFGPLGIIFAFVSSKDQRGLDKQQKRLEDEKLQRGELKKCPYCAELVRPEAKVCRHCGRDLIEINSSSQQKPLLPEVEPSRTGLLKKVQDSSQKICPQCHIPMVIKTATSGQHQGKKFYVCQNYKQCGQVFPVE